MILEAECTRCHETFNPTDEHDLEHVAREDGTECGGPGEMRGAWGQPAPFDFHCGGRTHRIRQGWTSEVVDGTTYLYRVAPDTVRAGGDPADEHPVVLSIDGQMRSAVDNFGPGDFYATREAAEAGAREPASDTTPADVREMVEVPPSAPGVGPDGRGNVATDEQIRDAVGRARREVAEDIAAGVVPADIRDVGDLHDHTDANTYGGLCDDGPLSPEFSYRDGTLVLAYVDAWLANGRAPVLPPVTDYLREQLTEQGRDLDPTLARRA